MGEWTTTHTSINLKGILANTKGNKINFLEDDAGRFLSDTEARKEINELINKGHKYMCCGNDCEGFDPFENGCPGHVVRKPTE